MRAATLLYILAMIPYANRAGVQSPDPGFDRPAFYTTLKTGSLDDINKEISLLQNSDIREKEAYTGALQMKKAALLKIGKQKLDSFKSGASKLENAIKKDSSNTEYHLLRLMIQENAPKIVHYRSQIANDSELIKKNFTTLSPFLQEMVKDYSKTSKTIHPEDF